MNMTPEQQTEWKDACDALRDGEAVQYLSDGRWIDTDSVDVEFPHRRKPKPDPLSLSSALANLAKCRDALEHIARYPNITATAMRDCARETLDATKCNPAPGNFPLVRDSWAW